jgi:hypothetical protein
VVIPEATTQAEKSYVSDITNGLMEKKKRQETALFEKTPHLPHGVGWNTSMWLLVL